MHAFAYLCCKNVKNALPSAYEARKILRSLPVYNLPTNGLYHVETHALSVSEPIVNPFHFTQIRFFTTKLEDGAFLAPVRFCLLNEPI